MCIPIRWRGRPIGLARAATGRYIPSRSACSTTAASCADSDASGVRAKRRCATPPSISGPWYPQRRYRPPRRVDRLPPPRRARRRNSTDLSRATARDSFRWLSGVPTRPGSADCRRDRRSTAERRHRGPARWRRQRATSASLRRRRRSAASRHISIAAHARARRSITWPDVPAAATCTVAAAVQLSRYRASWPTTPPPR